MNRQTLLCLLGLCLLGAALAADIPANLLPNGDVEAGMTGWKFSLTDPAKAGTAVTADAARYKGASALLLTLPTGTGANITSAPAPVQGGHDYLLTFWLRSEGFSRTGGYDGANASFNLNFYDAVGKPAGTVAGGLPYGAQKSWVRWLRLFTVPAGAVTAQFTLGANVNATALPSKLWLDEIALRAWDGAVKPNGRRWTFYAADGYYGRDLYRRAADDDAASGFAIIANTRFTEKTGVLAGGIYTRVLPPGTYRALFRLRVAAQPDPPAPVAALDVNPQNGGAGNVRGLTTADFARAGVYQEIPLRFVVSPETGYVDFRVNWLGKATTWVDTITIVEEEIYRNDQLNALLY